MAGCGAGCGTKSKEAAPAPAPPPDKGAAAVGSASAGSAGSADAVPVKVAPLRWTTPAGEPLLAINGDGSVDGPCGTVGKLAGAEIMIGAQKLAWSAVDRKGTKYQVPPMLWTIEVAPGGDVTLTQPAKPGVPLGKVTGTETEEGAKLFAALVVAAPTIQIELSLDSTDATVSYALSGSADLDAWTIKAATHVVATKTRDQAHGALATELADGLPAGAVTVTASAPGTYEVAIAGAPEAYGAATYTVTEDDGLLRWKPAGAKAPLPLAALNGRKACKPHDKAVAALLETFLASKAGWTTTRGAELKWFGKK